VTDTAIAVLNGGDTLQLGAFTLATTGLVVAGTPTESEWVACGKVLRRVEGAVQFWIGDWVNYGEKAYGEKYTEAVDVVGLDYETARKYAYVAHNVELCLRRHNVGYSIHKEIAPLPPEQQAAILDRAASSIDTARLVL